MCVFISIHTPPDLPLQPFLVYSASKTFDIEEYTYIGPNIVVVSCLTTYTLFFQLLIAEKFDQIADSDWQN